MFNARIETVDTTNASKTDLPRRATLSQQTAFPLDEVAQGRRPGCLAYLPALPTAVLVRPALCCTIITAQRPSQCGSCTIANRVRRLVEPGNLARDS